jgi:hypothetical protein
MTTDEARVYLSRIIRPNGNPGYTDQLSDLEIEGWIAFFKALGLVKDNA